MAKKARRSNLIVSAKSAKSGSIGLNPLSDRVVLKPTEEKGESKTASGLYIPESGKDTGLKKGEVVAIGPGKWEDGAYHPVSVSVGDEVLYQWGEKITYKNVEYVVVRDGEIVAKVK
ncbi:MAG: co-chaperone GroES [Patescibacteria group bacterium]